MKRHYSGEVENLYII